MTILDNMMAERRKRKEAFRKLHEESQTPNEDVMNRFYGISSNRHKPVCIDGVTLERVLLKHGHQGAIFIGFNCVPQTRIHEMTKALINDLKKSGCSYLPIYGKFSNPDGSEMDYIPSFLFFNEGANVLSKDAFIQFSLKLRASYGEWFCADESCVWKGYVHGQCYVNPMPCQLSERMRRKGEIMIWE